VGFLGVGEWSAVVPEEIGSTDMLCFRYWVAFISS